MDIYPQDLGRALEGEARRRREYFRRAPLPAARATAEQPHWATAPLNPVFAFLPFVVFLGIMETGKPLSWSPYVIILGAVIGLTLLSRRLPVWWKHRKRLARSTTPQGDAPLTMQETEWLRAEQTDILQGAFLELAQTALASPAPPDGLSHTHLRDALRALGDAVRDVPELSFKLTPRDAREMQTVAERLTQDAAQETDTVVADSLRRRADALHSQAETVTRAQSLLRRNAALRLELFDQMAALRTGLAASAIGHTGGARDLSALAASIASVAAEAAAVTGARAEVDSFLHAAPEQETQKMIR